MKIAIFHLAFIYSGGGEKLVLEEAKNLVKQGHKVSIFACATDKDKCFPKTIKSYDIKPFIPKLPHFIHQWEVFQILLTSLLAPLFAFRFRNYDVILAANQPSPWIAFWVKLFFGVPYVTYLSQPTRFLYPRKVDKETGLIFGNKESFELATRLMKMTRFFINLVDRVSIKESSSILSDGKYVQKNLEKTYKLKETVLCPAGTYVSGKRLSFSSRYSGDLTINRQKISKPYILITNRHFPQKRFEYMISALPIILDKFPDISLVITGQESEYTTQVKSLVKRLSLEKNVVFLGLVSEENLERLYSEASVYCYTAPEEDFGMGIVEAMSFKTPVVAWDKAGPTGIIDDSKNGFLAKPFDIADFAEKIIKILKNPKLAKKIAANAQEKVKAEFSYKKHMLIVENELTRVAKENYSNYPLYSSFTNRKYLHLSYTLNALKKINGNVLDVGCGSGRLTSEVKKVRPDLKVIGCDNQQNPLDYFGKFFGGGVKIVRCDAQRLPFSKKSFAAVFMIDVLEHLKHPKEAIKEVNRVLKKGGIFHLAVPCEKSLATWDGWLYSLLKINLKESVGHIQLFTSEEVKKMLQSSSFRVVDYYYNQHFIEQLCSFPYYLYIKVFNRGESFNLRQKGESFKPLSFFLKLGAVLANSESTILKKLKGRTLHITVKKTN
ncbi:glycosyltransferase [Patescibacteria group bacterium]